MLRSEKNLKSNLTDLDLVSNKRVLRVIKKGFKLREELDWRNHELTDKTWEEARLGELWELRHCGETDMWICTDPKWNGDSWISLDGQWCILGGGVNYIEQGYFTGITYSKEELDLPWDS